MPQPSWTISLGADSAGLDYKTILKADLEKDPRVKKVIDVGVTKEGGDIDRAYPHVGIAAAEKVSQGEADRALLVCGTGRSGDIAWFSGGADGGDARYGSCDLGL